MSRWLIFNEGIKKTGYLSKQMANILTGIRIVISVVLLFCPVLSPAFFIFYITAGISDMADGAVASVSACKYIDSLEV